MEILVGFMIVGVAGGLAFVTRANWGSHLGQSLGKRYMEEFGMNNEYQNMKKLGEGEKRE